MAKKKICSRAGCNVLVKEGSGYCDKHRKQGKITWKFNEIHQQHQQQPDYHTVAWRTVRAQALERDQHKCVKCGGVGNTVHHIIPHIAGNAHVLENLETLCKRCHYIESNKAWKAKQNKSKGTGGYITPPGYNPNHTDPLPPWQLERRKREGK